VNEATSQAQVPSFPIAVANNSSVRKETAPKIDSFVTRCFKTLIAARPAMGDSFAPAKAIVTGNNRTDTTEP
jgi:hypothetical protein